MSQAIPTPESLSVPEAAVSGHGRWPPSVDFHRQHELDWSEIEMALHGISTAAVAVEILGRSAVDSVHSERLDEVFDSVRADIEEQVSRLKELLGLATEVQS